MCIVSIILTTYNRESFLAEAVNSVLAQDYQSFELLVIDDASTDRSYEQLQPYLPYLTYLRHSENRGVSAARNTGLEYSKGKYLCFLDSDDLWEKKKLSSQMRFLQTNPTYQVCYTNETWLHQGHWLNQKEKHRKYSGYIFEKLLPLCIISPSSIIIARHLLEQIGYFDESFPACEDYELWLRLGSQYPIGYLEKRLIVKRGGHIDQLSQKYLGLDKLRIKAILKILGSGILSIPQWEAAWEELNKKCRIFGCGCLHHQREEEAAFFFSIPEQLTLPTNSAHLLTLLSSPFFQTLPLRGTEKQ